MSTCPARRRPCWRRCTPRRWTPTSRTRSWAIGTPRRSSSESTTTGKRPAITARTSPSVTTRSAHFDNWARQFLAVHPRPWCCTWAAGWTAGSSGWIPVPGSSGMTSTIPTSLRCAGSSTRRREHYHVIAASVTDPAWLADIPGDRPTLMIAEGLTMYLTEEDGVALLRRIVEHFPSGELQFDAFNRLGIKSQWTNAVVRRSGATLYWGDQRTRRHRRGGTRRAAADLGVALRLRHLRARPRGTTG